MILGCSQRLTWRGAVYLLNVLATALGIAVFVAGLEDMHAKVLLRLECDCSSASCVAPVHQLSAYVQHYFVGVSALLRDAENACGRQADKGRILEMFSQQNEKVELERPVEARGGEMVNAD